MCPKLIVTQVAERKVAGHKLLVKGPEEVSDSSRLLSFPIVKPWGL